MKLRKIKIEISWSCELNDAAKRSTNIKLSSLLRWDIEIVILLHSNMFLCIMLMIKKFYIKYQQHFVFTDLSLSKGNVCNSKLLNVLFLIFTQFIKGKISIQPKLVLALLVYTLSLLTFGLAKKVLDSIIMFLIQFWLWFR